MARQSATQHLGVLETANLVTTVRRRREKLHYLNPVPLWDIAERWIEKFERPRLRALSRIKRRAALKSIRAARPGGYRLFVIMDNLAANKTPAIRRWARHENVELCFTSTNAS
jgi:hypothetical protein